VLTIRQARGARFGQSERVSAAADRPPDEATGHVVLRVRSTTAILTGLWLWIFGLLAFTALTAGSALGAAVGGVLIVMGLVAAVRTWRSAMLVDESGVTIRNIWRTRSWSWHEIGEIGSDNPGWNRFAGPIHAISVCPLGDPYTYPASATATDPDRTARHAAMLEPFLAKHGVTDRIFDEVTSTIRWPLNPRSREATTKP
jgi:Bacterial PH domain